MENWSWIWYFSSSTPSPLRLHKPFDFPTWRLLWLQIVLQHQSPSVSCHDIMERGNAGWLLMSETVSRHQCFLWEFQSSSHCWVIHRGTAEGFLGKRAVSVFQRKTWANDLLINYEVMEITIKRTEWHFIYSWSTDKTVCFTLKLFIRAAPFLKSANIIKSTGKEISWQTDLSPVFTSREKSDRKSTKLVN